MTIDTTWNDILLAFINIQVENERRKPDKQVIKIHVGKGKDALATLIKSELGDTLEYKIFSSLNIKQKDD